MDNDSFHGNIEKILRLFREIFFLIKSILLNWYKQKAIEILTPRIIYFAEHIGVERKKNKYY